MQHVTSMGVRIISWFTATKVVYSNDYLRDYASCLFLAKAMILG